MKKEDLRKVVYGIRQPNSPDYNGYFHYIGPGERIGFGDIITYAFVENKETGLMESTYPDNIRFVDDWPNP